MRPFVLGAATALMMLAGTAQQAWACRADQVEIMGDFGTVRFRVEVGHARVARTGFDVRAADATDVGHVVCL